MVECNGGIRVDKAWRCNCNVQDFFSVDVANVEYIVPARFMHYELEQASDIWKCMSWVLTAICHYNV